MNDNVVSSLYHLHLADAPLTTTELAKRVFDPDGTKELRNADRKIRRYVEETAPSLVDQTEREDGTKLFRLDDDSVFFGVGKVTVLSPPESEVEVGLGSVMVYVDPDDGPQVVGLEREVADEDIDGSDV